ncbi:hypothetical protein BVRB_3g057060 [Beta vulgaris subsp. vulgaris]|nr:hypothetical protein BVRB_3g057060 [Beta vulgaris subsp. vulgaris]
MRWEGEREARREEEAEGGAARDATGWGEGGGDTTREEEVVVLWWNIGRRRKENDFVPTKQHLTSKGFAFLSLFTPFLIPFPLPHDNQTPLK